MRKIFILLAALLCLCDVRAGDVELWIGWKPLEGAVRYELEVLGSNKFRQTPKLGAKKMDWTMRVPPGAYIFRLRGIDAFKRPGAWAEGPTQVLLDAPQIKNAESTTIPLGQSVKLRWNEVVGAEKYQLWIWKGEHVVEKKSLSDTSWSFEPAASGDYRWSVAALAESYGKFDAPRDPASGPPSAKHLLRVVGNAERKLASSENGSGLSSELTSIRFGLTYFSNSFETIQSTSVGKASGMGIGGSAEAAFPLWKSLSLLVRGGMDRYEIDVHSLSREYADILLKLQLLGRSREDGAAFSVYAGNGLRKHLDIVSNGNTSTETRRFWTMGLEVGLQAFIPLGRRLNARARLGFRTLCRSVGPFAAGDGNIIDNLRAELLVEHLLFPSVAIYLAPSYSSDSIQYSSNDFNTANRIRDTVLRTIAGVRIIF